MKEQSNDLKAIKVTSIINTCLLGILTFFVLFGSSFSLDTTYSNKDNNSGNDKDNNNEIEPSVTDEYDVSMFKSIDEDGFISTSKSSTPKVIYLGRSSCGYCLQFLPILKKAQENIDYTTYYVDITTVDTSSDNYTNMKDMINGMTDSFNKKYDLTGDNAYEYLYGYTPLVVVVKNGKISDIWVGYSEYDTFVDWLADNGVK